MNNTENISSLLQEHIDGHAKLLIFKRNEPIYQQGEQARAIYLIKSGLVGLFHVSEAGKESFLRVFAQDSIFGHRSVIAQEPYHASSIALNHTKVLKITYELFEEACNKSPLLLWKIAQLLAKDLRVAEVRLSHLSDHTANRRIVESMIFLKCRSPEYTWTRKEIADFSGSTLETVTRLMTDLTSKGLILKDKRSFYIQDVDALLKYSQTHF